MATGPLSECSIFACRKEPIVNVLRPVRLKGGQHWSETIEVLLKLCERHKDVV